jgi:hypothetical protein
MPDEKSAPAFEVRPSGRLGRRDFIFTGPGLEGGFYVFRDGWPDEVKARRITEILNLAYEEGRASATRDPDDPAGETADERRDPISS